MTAIVPASASVAISIRPELVARVRQYAAAATSANTRRAYSRQWAAFVAWCDARRLSSLPARPESVALYVSELAELGRKVATIEQAMAAVTAAHRTAGHPSPREDAGLRATLKGIRRDLTVAQRQAAPCLAEHLRAMVAAMGVDTLAGLRDRALLLCGFAGAFRRSELVALEVRDVAFVTEGVVVTLRRSKTDQEGAGRLVTLSYSGNPALCPVRCLRAWLDASATTAGPLFRAVKHGRPIGLALTGQTVSRVIKRAAAAAGLGAETFSGHSLRAGFVTQAKMNRKGEAAIMKQTGHKSVTMLMKYDRRADLWSDHAGAGLLD